MDHVVANMLFIPFALMLGADFGTGYYIWKSFIPSFIGNVIGAAFFAIPMTIAYVRPFEFFPSNCDFILTFLFAPPPSAVQRRTSLALVRGRIWR